MRKYVPVAIAALVCILVLVLARRRPPPPKASPTSSSSEVVVQTKFSVPELVTKMRSADPLPMGTSVRVKGQAAERAEPGYDTTHTRLDILPPGGNGTLYVMCLGPERSDAKLLAAVGKEVSVVGSLAPGGGAYPVLRGCRIVSP